MRRTLLALSTLAILATTACKRSPIQFGTEPGFRFEPTPRTLPFALRRPVVSTTVTGGLYLLGTETGMDNETSTLQLRSSDDGGEHWMQPVNLNPAGSRVTTSSENAPQLATRGMYVYALWQQKSGDAPAQIVLSRSGTMDSKPAHLTTVTDKPATDTSYSGFSSLTIAPNGDIYVAWLDGRNPAPNSAGTFAVYLARSTDKGMTFHANVRVATLSCPCCRPSVAIAEDGSVYVAYRHVYDDNERDIALAVSHDRGEHFDEPIRVSTDRWKLFGCPESGPVIATQGKRLVVAWHTASEQKPGLRIAASTDGGRSFSTAQMISGDILSANHPYLSAREDGSLAITFSGRTASSNGQWSSTVPYLFRIDAAGKASQPVSIAGATGTRYPTAALAADGSTFVAYGTDNEKPAVYLARGVLQ